MRRRLPIGIVLLVLGLAALWAPRGRAQTIAPSPFQTVFDNSGKIVNNACVWTYVAGTTTLATTWTDSALSAPNLNPIRSDSAGRFTAFLAVGSSYKFVYEASCTPPSHGSVYRTADNITANPSSASNVTTVGIAGATLNTGQCAYLSDGSGSKTAGSWYACDSAQSYSSFTPIVGISLGTITTGTTGSIQLAGQVAGLSALTIGASYYVSTAGALTTTVMPRFLGVADTTTTLQMQANPPPLVTSGWTTVTTTATGTQNDFAPAGFIGNVVLRCNNASLLTISGFAGGYDKQQLVVESIGAGQVDFTHQDTGSTTAADRLINFATATGSKTSLAPGVGTAAYVYDGTTARWRLIRHEQGAWISPAFSAGDFTASTGSWTVTGGQVLADRYYLKGRTLMVALTVSGTTVGGTPGNLQRKAYGYTLADRFDQILLENDNGTIDDGTISSTPGATILQFYRKTGNWATATTATSFFYVGQVDVQ